ncbi:hypothetical protein EDD29_8901 [Actinocorallia herbida]|uniref:Uncharacterized protein n=1 Tax=Actinocorallia herbida TaxID=58109 RepID=A0A3N1DC96_9ACTN|nr:hypothetical protein [Actinocorallia herbida]ROO91154.1 hypothetical protein EDD29_8901 [Actinocorallia herbida]
MGYPGDSNQQRPSWDSDPLDASEDDWSRHPLSAPVPPQQPPLPPEEQPSEGTASWHGPESGAAWAGEQPGGAWLEGAAARQQGPLDDKPWPEAPQGGQPENPLAAPSAGYADPAVAGYGNNSWQPSPEAAYDGPSGPQQSPWHDGVGARGAGPGVPAPSGEPAGGYDNPTIATPPPAAEGGTGTYALPQYGEPQRFEQEAGSGPYQQVAEQDPYAREAYAQDPYAQDPYAAPQGAYAADPYGDEARHDAERFGGGATASGSYEVPRYDADRSFSGAQAVPPPAGWGEPRAESVPPQQARAAQGDSPYDRGEQWQPDGAREEIGSERRGGGGGGGRKGLIIAGGLVAAVVVAGAGAYALTRGDEKPPGGGAMQTGGQNPVPGDSADPGTGASAEPSLPVSAGLLKSRKTDPKPLKPGEVFAKDKFTVQGTTYVMHIRKVSKDCSAAVHGTALQSALKKGKCTQFLRATFATKDGRMIGTVGVANLATSQAAAKAEKAAGDKDAYVVALPGKGVTAKIGQGDALGAAWTRGHYLIMTWVQTPNGKPVPAKSKKRARIFAQNTVNGSNLGPALHYRDAMGKPPN